MSQSKLSRTVTVANPEGMHLRTATLVARLVRRFQAQVGLSKDCERVDATDVLQVVSLGAAQGDQLLMEAVGPDANAVIDAVSLLFECQFNDEITRQFGLQGTEDLNGQGS